MSYVPMPTNDDNVIDSRDVIARIEILEAEIEALKEKLGDDPDTAGKADEIYELADAEEELSKLQELAEEASSAADWTIGETLIRDSYFEDYARELASDIGAINEDAGWPSSFIDWEAAAEALQMGYWTVDFDGVQYWIRP